MHKLGVSAVGLGIALVAAACGDSDSTADAPTATVEQAPATEAPPPPTTEAPAPTETTAAPVEEPATTVETTVVEEPAPVLSLSFDGLEPLGDDAVYEGWVIVDGSPVSTGRFDVGADGGLVDDDGASIVAFDLPDGFIIGDAAAVVITIEPFDDPDPAPAATKILGGDLVDGEAGLSGAHPAALGTDFSEATGTFVLATPSDGNGNNELSGVWFIALPGPVAGLDLPALPAGWAYEGWVVIDGQPVTTGTFLDTSAADDFDGFSGDQGGPAFPGEDFIVNAPEGLVFPTDLTGTTVVISVEPSPDNSPAPFTLKPLLGEVPQGIGDHEAIALGAGPLAPTGIASIS